MTSFWKNIFSSKTFCLNCNDELRSGNLPGICNLCLQYFDFNGLNFWDTGLIKVYSPLIYGGMIKDLIYKLKYDGEELVAYSLGVIMADYIRYLKLYDNNTILVPIPLAKKREAKRGFNQASLLAEVIAGELKVSVNNNLLYRKQETPPLYNLSPGQRKMVLEGAFSLNNNFSHLNNRNIILIDDILTTGSTLNEAVRILYNAGALNIIGLTAVMALKKEKFDKGLNL